MVCSRVDDCFGFEPKGMHPCKVVLMMMGLSLVDHQGLSSPLRSFRLACGLLQGRQGRETLYAELWQQSGQIFRLPR